MLLIIIASVLTCSAADFSIVTPNASVSAWLGSSVILPCSLSPPLNARDFEVQWYKKKDSQKTVLLHQEQKVQENDVDDQYRDRVSLIGELDNGNVSLKLDNLKTADRGEYTCFVKSLRWYERGSMNLVVKAIGSTPVLSYQEAGEQLNVSCTSDGWSPKPLLTWRDSTGRELTNTYTKYITDSEGLVDVRSWMLFSPSDSEWISCTVDLNLQGMKESRVVPMKSLLPHCSSRKNAKAAGNIHPVLLHFIQTQKKQFIYFHFYHAADSHESLPGETIPLKATENLHQASLTLDPSSAPTSLKVSADRKIVYCRKPNSGPECKFPHLVSKEEWSSGQHYWEVMLWDKTSTKPKSSWSVGVIQKHTTENIIRTLCYKEGTGLYTNTHDFSIITTEFNVRKLGVHLNCDRKSLSFFNADKNTDNHLHTFYNIPQGTYFAFFSPGVKDSQPLKIINDHENSEDCCRVQQVELPGSKINGVHT
ncbi:butyrophilin subfamily 2 member A2-like isoform X1 [Silurus meridionalis]|nr:butyrophilin subfamily 2 member A2-like isoform X1 [Silurus meridionalis]